MTRTLLLDADLIAYRASSATQRSYDWNGDGKKSYAADFEAAVEMAERTIDDYATKLKADEVLVCLSDDFSSFRKDRVDPTYKAIRDDVDRPVHLYDIKDHLADTYEFVRWTALEADDVMGIIATDPNRTDERIIVSADKDMKTIPGKLHQPAVYNTMTGALIRPAQTIDISVEEADRFHLYQTIVGDQTDGYPGLPGAGPKAAEEVLNGVQWVQQERTLKSGPRKGLTISEWVRTEGDYIPAWLRVVALYEKAGLTEEHALKQARLARILRYGEWDGRSPRLWTPTLY